MLGLYTVNAQGRPMPPGWRLWVFVLGAPCLAALLLIGLWHALQDHALLHRLPPALTGGLEQVQKRVEERIAEVEKRAADPEPVRAVEARVQELERRLQGAENAVQDLLRR